MKKTEATKLGWTFGKTDDGLDYAEREDGRRIEVATDGDAETFLLANIAEAEGKGDTPGYRPPTDDELLDMRRQGAQANVAAVLAGTDKWAARAYEDGEQMSGARKAYRQALRAAYQQISTSDDPESVTLPEPPAAE